jgi:hypothetical protein
MDEPASTGLPWVDSTFRHFIKELVEEIEELRVLDGGPLEVSKMVEPITPFILNRKLFGLKRDLTIKFISQLTLSSRFGLCKSQEIFLSPRKAWEGKGAGILNKRMLK